MVSSALGKISIDCSPPPSDGPSDESFQLSLLSFFGAPSLSALGSCPSRLPLNLPLFAGHTNMAYTHTYIHTHTHTHKQTDRSTSCVAIHSYRYTMRPKIIIMCISLILLWNDDGVWISSYHCCCRKPSGLRSEEAAQTSDEQQPSCAQSHRM